MLAAEVERRKHRTSVRRLHRVSVKSDKNLERFDWDAKIALDYDRHNAIIGL